MAAMMPETIVQQRVASAVMPRMPVRCSNSLASREPVLPAGAANKRRSRRVAARTRSAAGARETASLQPNRMVTTIPRVYPLRHLYRRERLTKGHAGLPTGEIGGNRDPLLRPPLICTKAFGQQAQRRKAEWPWRYHVSRGTEPEGLPAPLDEVQSRFTLAASDGPCVNPCNQGIGPVRKDAVKPVATKGGEA